MKGVHICCFIDSTQHIIDANGKKWFFEMHQYCGPAVLNKDGDPAKNQPGVKSPFWDCVSLWAQQGEKVVDGIAVWKAPPQPKLVHLGGNHYKVVEE